MLHPCTTHPNPTFDCRAPTATRRISVARSRLWHNHACPTRQVLHPLPLPARSQCSHPFTRNTRPNQYIHTHHETAAPSAARMNHISTTPFHAEWGRSHAWARGEGEVGGLVSPAVVAFVLFVRPPVVMSGGGVDRLVLNPCAKEATRRRARVSRGVEGGGRRSGVRSR